MSKSKSKLDRTKSIWFPLLGLVCLGLLMAILLKGHNLQLFNPQGFVANGQHRLMMLSVLVILVIALPTLFILYFFAWRYRETGKKAHLVPRANNGRFVVFVSWSIPALGIITLASLMLPATQKLEPQRSIESNNKPLTVQVVALRWKWLFIYPEQKIATVNYVQIPVNTPVQFELTADEAPMNSFWIPQLGGQLYAMTGHQNRLNLMAQATGDYKGSAAEINGAGFAGMRFVTHVGSIPEFDQWVQEVKRYTNVLSSAEYAKILAPSQNRPPAFYRNPDADLYSNILSKYAGSHGHPAGHTEHEY